MEEHRGSRGGVGEDDTGRRDKERLAGAQKPCTGDNNDGDCKGGKIPSWLDGVGEIIIDHHQCQGTGLVYALDDSVRPKCPCLDLGGNTLCDGCSSHLREERFGNWHKDDCDCQGRGWTASEDGWWQAARQAGFWLSMYHSERGDNLVCHVWWGKDPTNHVWEKSENGDPNPLLVAALLKAGEAAGWTM